MNFAVVPFVFVIGLATLVYAVSGHKWFTGPVRDLDSITVIEEPIVQNTPSIIVLEEDEDQTNLEKGKTH